MSVLIQKRRWRVIFELITDIIIKYMMLEFYNKTSGVVKIIMKMFLYNVGTSHLQRGVLHHPSLIILLIWIRYGNIEKTTVLSISFQIYIIMHGASRPPARQHAHYYNDDFISANLSLTFFMSSVMLSSRFSDCSVVQPSVRRFPRTDQALNTSRSILR